MSTVGVLLPASAPQSAPLFTLSQSHQPAPRQSGPESSTAAWIRRLRVDGRGWLAGRQAGRCCARPADAVFPSRIDL
ncbi:hypothetical protein K402DRAFT_392563 [Aulographum hederae CBS 113979]|uniref:Uncharacterized protein n=1 Tax=Aulographum hederae CBS 113979 TaxID=1176131 RepID=A0A6G1H428_9PEZI|nr:hypothetical protein K402DRAFT_392563 [Aulographum hederae CBS 113979]